MGRIPLYTSRATMRTGPVVMPHPKMGTEVSEAVGRLARTVGKIADDWATAKRDTENQSSYVTNRIRDAKNKAELFKTFLDDPNPIKSDDPNDLHPEATFFTKQMQDKRKEYEFSSDFVKNKFMQTSQLSDVSDIQKLSNLNRHKIIDGLKVEGTANIKEAIELGNPELLKESFIPLDKAYSDAELDIIKADSWHDFEMTQASRMLALDPDADLSEFKLIKNEVAGLRTKAKTAARAEANRLKAERKEQEAIYFEQTNDAFVESFRENKLTIPEVDVSMLPTKGEGGKNYWRKRLTTKAADETNEVAGDYIRKKFALETITSIDIDSRQDKLTDEDYKAFKRQYKTRDKEIAIGKYIPSVFAEKTDMFTEELDRLTDNGTITTKEAEEAKLKLPEQLHDRAMKEGFTEKQIADYSEFLIGSYLLKESQIKKDASTFWKFINMAPYRAIPELIKSWRREERVEALPTEAEFPTEEVEEEAIEIKDIPPENVVHLSDWLKKNNKVVNEKNIRYLYEQLK